MGGLKGKNGVYKHILYAVHCTEAKKVQSGLEMIVFQNFILSHKDNNEDVGVQKIFISPQGKTHSCDKYGRLFLSI